MTLTEVALWIVSAIVFLWTAFGVVAFLYYCGVQVREFVDDLILTERMREREALEFQRMGDQVD